MILLLTLLALTLPLPLGAQSNIVGSFEHDGATRNYRLHLPPQYIRGGVIPLVLNPHGRGSNALEQELYSQMNAVADREGFAVCYPDGTNREWNVGWSFGTRADDVGFLLRLIDTLQTNYDLSASRTYSCGMSNGGFMSYELACRVPERFAAIGSVTGGMVPGRRATCRIDIAMPVMQIHGTADPVVPYNGSFINDPIDTTAAFWARRNDCEPNALAEDIPDRRADGFTSTRYTYVACRDRAEVQLIAVLGGRHTWPGGAVDLGGTTYDFSASEELWAFFARFQRIGPTSVRDGFRQNQPQGGLELSPNPYRAGPLYVQPKGASPAAVGGAVAQLQIFDQLGRQQGSWTGLAAAGTVVEPSTLAPGAYFVVWTQESVRQVGRLVVVH